VRVLVTTHGTLLEGEVNAIREAGYTERQIVEIALAVTSITFTNLVNRINDTEVDFPAAPAI
jgi:alkylhydroperoxidase family enzyme